MVDELLARLESRQRHRKQRDGRHRRQCEHDAVDGPSGQKRPFRRRRDLVPDRPRRESGQGQLPAYPPPSGGNKNILVRWFGFTRIEGSNDGTNYEVIAERVELTPNPNVYENLQTDNVPIPENDYRYLRFSGWNDVKQASPNLGFYCARGVEYGGINPGNTIQINEIYLGRAQE